MFEIFYSTNGLESLYVQILPSKKPLQAQDLWMTFLTEKMWDLLHNSTRDKRR